MQKLGGSPVDPVHSLKQPKQENKKQSKIDQVSNKIFDDYIESHGLNNSPPNLLVPEHLRLEKLRNDVKNELDSNDLNEIIKTAIDMLVADGKEFIEGEKYDEMCSQLSNIPAQLEKIDYNQPLEENPQTLLQIQDSVLQTISSIAKSEHKAGQLDKSLAMYIFLNTLVPEEPDYLYRMGLVARKLEKNELAVQAFKEAISLDPDFYQTRIYLADCYVLEDNIVDAEAQLDEIDFNAIENDWQKVVTNLRGVIKELKETPK